MPLVPSLTGPTATSSVAAGTSPASSACCSRGIFAWWGATSWSLRFFGGRAGERRSVEELCEPTAQSSYARVRRLFEATSATCGGVEALRHAGLAAPTVLRSASSYLEMFEAIGSPSALAARFGELHSMVSAISTEEPTEVGPCEWVVTQHMHVGFEPFPELCQFFAGLRSTCPVYFGLAPADVVEETCQVNGEDACRLRVRWDEAELDDDESSRSSYLAELVTTRLRVLQATVADLVGGRSLDAILWEVVTSTGKTVNAPAYILALDDLLAAPRRVYVHGLDDHDGERLANRLLGDKPPATGELVVDVRSAQRFYGRLAVVDPTGTRRYLPQEQEMLTTYASLAATALDAASALQEARQQTVAAQSMSDLLADERALLSKIVEGIPHGVAWTSNDGQIDGCNQALAQLLGHCEAQDVTKDLSG